jgi:two-component system, chemotaxis family, chemotaxis protein CheY
MMKILTVDDSAIIRKIVRGAVEVLGHETIEARDGQEAMEILNNEYQCIKLVLLDWNMPRMDGFSVLEKMQKDERFKGIPVTMVTTEADRRKIIKAIQAGAKNYVMKPFSQEDLIIKIMESLGRGI